MESLFRQPRAAPSFFYNLLVCQRPGPALQVGPGFVQPFRALLCPVQVTG